jgi:hypothetical protein
MHSGWLSLENNQCEAMFASHVHSWQKIQPHVGKTWQIIAGNGGSQWDSIWVEYQKPASTYQGYTLVKVAATGSVKVESWGHDLDNAKYMLAVPNTPTVLKDSADITWGTVATGISGAAHKTGFVIYQSGTRLAVQGAAGNAGTLTYEILAADGRKVSTGSVSASNGDRSGLIDLASLVPGSYVLDLRAGNVRESHAIIVR